MQAKTTEGSANPFGPEQLARDKARATRRNRAVASRIIFAAAGGAELLERERKRRNKRGSGICGCGRRISATRSKCRACADA